MSLTMIKILLLVACFGHVLCCFFRRISLFRGVVRRSRFGRDGAAALGVCVQHFADSNRIISV